MTRTLPRSFSLACLVSLALLALPAVATAPLKPAKAAPEPVFNRLHDYQEISEMLHGYAAAFPEWVSLESIGKSGEGRDIWVVTLTNPKTGDALSKPGIYIDGNTHANEVQGGESTIYTLDFLLKNYGTLERVTELVDRLTFYFLPMVNPDGRHRWFHQPATANFPRTVVVPIDDDRDGLADEDGYDNLDGDGETTPEESNAFDDLLTLGRQQVEWKEVDHPQYGKIEVGGNRHDVGRVPEGWMLNEEVHRNSLFVLHHAYHLPRLSFGEPVVR